MDLLDDVLFAMRRGSDEAQLTQALAAIAGHDTAFASELLKVWLDLAQSERVSALGPIPRELICRAEVDHGAYGRVDLEFRDRYGSFIVVVELKLDAAYGNDQLGRYVRAVRQTEATKRGVLAVTKHVPQFGEDSVANDEEWLGSVRWGKALSSMQALEAQSNPELNSAWKSLITACCKKGDFGTVIVEEDVLGWAKYSAGKNELIGLMNELVQPALEIIGSAVDDDGATDEPLVSQIVHKSRTVWPWKDSINLQFGIAPSLDSERLRIQFLALDGNLHFTVEARHPESSVSDTSAAAAVAAATKILEDDMDPPFAVGRDWENYWSRVHPAHEWLDDTDAIHERLLEFIARDVNDLVASGIFAALPTTPGLQSHEPDELVPDSARNAAEHPMS